MRAQYQRLLYHYEVDVIAVAAKAVIVAVVAAVAVRELVK